MSFTSSQGAQRRYFCFPRSAFFPPTSSPRLSSLLLFSPALTSCWESPRECRRAGVLNNLYANKMSSTAHRTSIRHLSTTQMFNKLQGWDCRSINTHRSFTKRSSQRSSRRSVVNSDDTSTADRIQQDLLQDAQQEYQQRQYHGIFQCQHIKPFPVRAAIDIGTGGAISLCIGRVDAQLGAVQKLIYQTQLPLYLEKLHHTSNDNDNGKSSSENFALSERTVDDIRNKMRVLHGAMRRNDFKGLSERAAVLSWPLCLATNAKHLAEELTREFKVDVRVLGASFNVQWPPSVVASSNHNSNSGTKDDTYTVYHDDGKTRKASARQPGQTTTNRHVESASAASLSKHQSENSLKALLRSASSLKDEQATMNKTERTQQKSAAVMGDLRTQLDTLAFLAHAAVGQCVAPQRLLVLHEDPQRGVRLLGLDTTPAEEVADLLDSADSAAAVAKIKAIAFGEIREGPTLGPDKNVRSADNHFADAPLLLHENLPLPQQRFSTPSAASRSVVPVREASEGLQLVEHTLPVDVAAAHRCCITHIQHRSPDTYGLHTSSPNPLLADQFRALRDVLAEMIRHDLPLWAIRKAQLGGMVVATSHNGGLFNIAARVSQQTHISLDHLEVHAQHHFCGLTDVLLAENFPNPLLVLPSAALSAAVLRAIESPRMLYIPEVTVAAALLVQPSLWLSSRAAEVRQRLSRDPFYASHTREQRGRVFERPHRKDNPTAAPDATRVMGERWNALSYEQSMKGT